MGSKGEVGEGGLRGPVSHRGRRVQRVSESRRNCGSFPNHTTAHHPFHLRQRERGERCAQQLPNKLESAASASSQKSCMRPHLQFARAETKL